MTDLVPIRRALLSVSDKTDLVPMARALAARHIELISTGGTARALTDAGLEVVSVDQITGFPEMMDGRVKTLHPAVHGGLLARRDLASHVQSMTAHGIAPIDLLIVNLYPFESTIARRETTEHEAIEQIDIGGPAMIRSAAKNHDFVCVVTDPRQYDSLISEIQAHDGATRAALRRELAAAAFMRTAAYDAAISSWMGQRTDPLFPDVLRRTFVHACELRYGENPHQRAAVYADPAFSGPSVVKARTVAGKPLSYNNLLDASAALELVQDLHFLAPGQTSAVIIKHTNPCGAAAAPSPVQAFEEAYAGDPVAAYGGILALSAPLGVETAQSIAAGQRFLEVVLAPGIDAAASSVLESRWKNVRLLSVADFDPAARPSLTSRSVAGGLLLQERDAMLATTGSWRHVAGPAPSAALLHSAAFAWTVAKHLSSNAIAIARGTKFIGGGSGQVDRVGACRIALERSADARAKEGPPAVAASDAFFPFPDGPQLLIDAGIRLLVHPGGSVRDDQTLSLCEKHGVTCLVTGIRHFRH